MDHFSGAVVFLCLKGSWNLRGWGEHLPWNQEEKEAAEEGSERVVVSGRCPHGSLFPQMLHACKLPTEILYSWETEPQHGGACANLRGNRYHLLPRIRIRLPCAITKHAGQTHNSHRKCGWPLQTHVAIVCHALGTGNPCCNCVPCIRYWNFNIWRRRREKT